MNPWNRISGPQAETSLWNTTTPVPEKTPPTPLGRSGSIPVAPATLQLSEVAERMLAPVMANWLSLSQRHAASSKYGPGSTLEQSRSHHDAWPIVQPRPKFLSKSFSWACFLNAKLPVATGVEEGQDCCQFIIRFSWGKVIRPRPSQRGSVGERIRWEALLVGRGTLVIAQTRKFCCCWSPTDLDYKDAGSPPGPNHSSQQPFQSKQRGQPGRRYQQHPCLPSTKALLPNVMS
jgi:hypothetical protein